MKEGDKLVEMWNINLRIREFFDLLTDSLDFEWWLEVYHFKQDYWAIYIKESSN